MAMGFSRATEPNMPSMVDATAQQGEIAAQLRAGENAERAGNLSSAATLAQMAPEGSWGALGSSLTGGGAGAGGTAASLAPVTDLATGAIMTPTAAPLAAGAGAGGGGVGSALAGLGPMGWAAMAAMALGALG